MTFLKYESVPHIFLWNAQFSGYSMKKVENIKKIHRSICSLIYQEISLTNSNNNSNREFSDLE